MQETGDDEREWRDLAFGVERSIRYHDCRSDFLRRFSKFCTLVAVVGGAGTTVAVISQGSRWLQLSLPAIVTVVSLANLVFDFRGGSDQHRQLSAKFSELLRDLETLTDRAAVKLVALKDRRRKLENEAPAPMKMLDVCCHNDLIRAKGYSEDEFYDLKWWQSALKQFISVGRIPQSRAAKSGGTGKHSYDSSGATCERGTRDTSAPVSSNIGTS